jgi:hypothetical protein
VVLQSRSLSRVQRNGIATGLLAGVKGAQAPHQDRRFMEEAEPPKGRF